MICSLFTVVRHRNGNRWVGYIIKLTINSSWASSSQSATLSCKNGISSRKSYMWAALSLSLCLWLQCKRRRLQFLERNHKQKCWFTSAEWINCTGSICKWKSSGRWPVTETWVVEVWAVLIWSLYKSSKHAAQEKPYTTVNKILQKSFQFKNYVYQLLQHVTAENKETIHFSDFLSGLEDNKLIQPKLSSMIKPHSIYLKMLINIPWKCVEQQSSWSNWTHERQFQIEYVSFFV